MATRTSVGTGNWSVAGTWDTGVPVDTDDFVIAAGHTVTFDVDQSGMGSGMAASSIAATGTLICSTATGAYVLKMNADLTVAGTFQAGTSVGTPLPSDVTFTIDFNAGSNSLVLNDATGNVQFFCIEPTYKYVTLTAQEPAAETAIAVDNDVTADIWAVNDEVLVTDIIIPVTSTMDNEVATIGGTAAAVITLAGGGLATQKEIDAKMTLLTRNIRLINGTDYAIKSGEDVPSVVNAEIRTNYGVTLTGNSTFGGVICCGFAAGRCLYICQNATVNSILCNSLSVNTGRGLLSMNLSTVTANAGIFGILVGVGGTANNIECPITGCRDAGLQCNYCTFTGDITGCQNGIATANGFSFTGNMYKMKQGFSSCSDFIVGNAIICDNTGTPNPATQDVYRGGSGSFFNCLFNATSEFTQYASGVARNKFHYIDSWDHDQVTNAYKAWCLGGIVTSDETSPPSGYDRWYEHACEYVATGNFPCFRQFLTTVQPGTAIEVIGQIRIADGEDLSSDPPALQIIDKFADPLVDSTASPLDEDEIPEPDGGVENGWQDVDVIWANTGDSPRIVYVRMYASVADVTANVDVDEVWAIATYKDQINEILKRVKRISAGSEIA